MIKCLAGNQKVFLWPSVFCLRQPDQLADVYPVSKPLLDLLCGLWSNFESIVFIGKLAAASCVGWTEKLLESDQSVLGYLVVLSRLADVRVQVGQGLLLGAVLRAVALGRLQ